MTVTETNYNIQPVKNEYLDFIQNLERKRLTNGLFAENLQLPYKIRVVIYLRVSTLPQAGLDKTSLKEQKEEAIKYANNQGWVIVKIYCDTSTGTNTEKRDGFNQILIDAKNGLFDVLIGWTADRLARNLDDMYARRALLKANNIQITTVKEPSSIVDPRIYSLKEQDSTKIIIDYLLDWKAEQDNISRVNRFQLGKIGKAKNGKIPVKVPYGYRKKVYFKNGDPKKKIEIDEIVEIEAEIVKEIFNHYDKDSWGMRKIAEYLNLKGVSSPSGKKWCYSAIKYILQNPTYTGLVRYGWRLSQSKKSRSRLHEGHEGIITKGNHLLIIEPEQYKKVQDKQKIRNKLGGKAVSSKGLLTGILKCGRCGGGTYIKSFPNWYAYKKTATERHKHKKSQAYVCSKYSAYGRSGCTTSYVVYAEKIHKIVIDKIDKLANSKEARTAFAKHVKKNNSAILKIKLKNLEKILISLEEKTRRIKKAYIDGKFTLDEFDEENKKIEVEKKQCITEIEETKIKLLKEEKIAHQTENALLALTDFQKSWNTATFTEKKELFQVILDKIVVKENNVQIYFSQSDVSNQSQ